MKRIFSILFAAVLVLSFSLIPAVPAMATGTTTTLSIPDNVYRPAPFDVSGTTTNDGTAYNNVRFSITVSGPVDFTGDRADTFTITHLNGGTDTQGINGTFVLVDGDFVGGWGPEVGFGLTDPYDETSVFTIQMNDGGTAPEGDYEVTVALVDLTPDPEVTLASATDGFTLSADTLYVGAEQQFTTIQSAIDAASDGDTINVVAGTYTENVVILPGKDNLQLIGAGSDVTTIDGNDSGIVVIIASDGVAFSGFTVTGSGSSPLVDGGVALFGVTGCTIEGNIVSNNDGIGIGLQNADGNTIRGNTLNLNHITGIGLQGSDGNTIEGNTSTNTIEVPLPLEPINYVGYGIWLDYSTTGGGSSVGNTINGNTFSGNQIDGVYFGQGGVGNTLTNNTITNNGVNLRPDGHGVYFWMGGGNTVTGNTITGNRASGIQLFQSAGNLINFNSIYGNGYGINTDTDVDATCNWWGDCSGPSGVGLGSGDSVSANVEYDPWLGQQLCALKVAIAALPDNAFTKPKAATNQREALLNKIDAVCGQIEDGAYRGALNKLEKDIKRAIQRWIVEDEQEDLIQKVEAEIDILENFLQ